MNEHILKKAADFHGINSLCLTGEIVIFGSTYMADFPFYELINKSRLESAVYNRSIRGLTIGEADRMLDDCVFSLDPRKVFLALGDCDRLCAETAEAYEILINAVQSGLPSAKLYLLPPPFGKEDPCDGDTAAFTDRMTVLCEDKSIRLIRLSRGDYRRQFAELTCFFRKRPITFSEAFAMVSL